MQATVGGEPAHGRDHDPHRLGEASPHLVDEDGGEDPERDPDQHGESHLLERADQGVEHAGPDIACPLAQVSSTLFRVEASRCHESRRLECP